MIQESAHEDANIIFGAVIDPNLKGRIKITVIATGFDRQDSARDVPAAALQTPVDLTSYTAHLGRTEPAVDMPVTPMETAAHATGGQAPTLSVTRRAPLELSFPSAASAGVEDARLDPLSPLDVPAFLRRQI